MSEHRTDEQIADDLRSKVEQLNSVISEALIAGLIVEVHQHAIERLGPRGVERQPIVRTSIARPV